MPVFESDISLSTGSRAAEKREIVYHSAIQIYYSLLENIVNAGQWSMGDSKRPAMLWTSNAASYSRSCIILRNSRRAARDRDLFERNTFRANENSVRRSPLVVYRKIESSPTFSLFYYTFNEFSPSQINILCIIEVNFTYKTLTENN